MGVTDKRLQEVLAQDYQMLTFVSRQDGARVYQHDRTAVNLRARALAERAGWTLSEDFLTDDPVTLTHPWTSEDPDWAPTPGDGATSTLSVVNEILDGGGTRRVSGRQVGQDRFEIVDPGSGLVVNRLHVAGTAADGGQRWTAPVLSSSDAEYFYAVASAAGWTAATGRFGRVMHSFRRGLNLRTEADKALDFVRYVVSNGMRLRDDVVFPDYSLYRLPINDKFVMVRAIVDAGRVVRARGPLPFDVSLQEHDGHGRLEDLWEAGWQIRLTSHAGAVDVENKRVYLDVFSERAWSTLFDAHRVAFSSPDSTAVGQDSDPTVFPMTDLPSAPRS